MKGEGVIKNMYEQDSSSVISRMSNTRNINFHTILSHCKNVSLWTKALDWTSLKGYYIQNMF